MKISFGKVNFRILVIVVCLLFDITPVWAISTVSSVADATLTFNLLAGSTTSRIYGVLQSPDSLALSNSNELVLLPGDNVSLTSGNINLNTSAVSLSNYSLSTGSVGLLGGNISLNTGLFVTGVNISPNGGMLALNGNIPAVPEPDIVLMMIIGIGVLGAVVRRRAVVLPEKPGS